ncbi:hypothetical protein VTK26DRAFT_808 [Humicola hyalothermophila]
MIPTNLPWNRILAPSHPIALRQPQRATTALIRAVRMSSSQPSARPSEPIYFGPFEVTSQVFLTTPHSFALVNLKPLLPGHVLVCPLRPHRRLTDLGPAELTDLFATVQRVQRMLARQYFAAAAPPPPPSPSLPPSSSSSSSTSPTSPTATATAATAAAASPEQGSFNLALQDGPEAGQTVSHVHVHVIPRIRGSTAKPASTPSDQIYEDMADEAGNVGGALWDLAHAGGDGNGDGAGAGAGPDSRDGRTGRGKGKGKGEGDGGRPVPGGKFSSIEDADRRARSMAEMEEEAAVYRAVLAAMEAEERR